MIADTEASQHPLNRKEPEDAEAKQKDRRAHYLQLDIEADSWYFPAAGKKTPWIRLTERHTFARSFVGIVRSIPNKF
jgi:hypothetical protein